MYAKIYEAQEGMKQKKHQSFKTITSDLSLTYKDQIKTHHLHNAKKKKKKIRFVINLQRPNKKHITYIILKNTINNLNVHQAQHSYKINTVN